MIPIDIIKATALTLMEKASIEIPDDYLQGLKAAAAAEDGDLSSFVLQTMLEQERRFQVRPCQGGPGGG